MARYQLVYNKGKGLLQGEVGGYVGIRDWPCIKPVNTLVFCRYPRCLTSIRSPCSCRSKHPSSYSSAIILSFLRYESLISINFCFNSFSTCFTSSPAPFDSSGTPSFSPNGHMLSRGLQNDVNRTKMCCMEAEWLKEKPLNLAYIGKTSLLVMSL